jgi:hypothetical protein
MTDREALNRIAAERLSHFRKTWRPSRTPGREYCDGEFEREAFEFERDLDDLVQSVIYNAYREAQAPFVAQFNSMKKHILDPMKLAPPKGL